VSRLPVRHAIVGDGFGAVLRVPYPRSLAGTQLDVTKIAYRAAASPSAIEKVATATGTNGITFTTAADEIAIRILPAEAAALTEGLYRHDAFFEIGLDAEKREHLFTGLLRRSAVDASWLDGSEANVLQFDVTFAAGEDSIAVLFATEGLADMDSAAYEVAVTPKAFTGGALQPLADPLPTALATTGFTLGFADAALAPAAGETYVYVLTIKRA